MQPWVEVFKEYAVASQSDPKCDENKLEECLFQHQLDIFNGMKEKDANLKAHNCAITTFCTMPLFDEDFKEYDKKGGKL